MITLMNIIDIFVALSLVFGFSYSLYKKKNKGAIAFVGMTVAWLILRFYVK